AAAASTNETETAPPTETETETQQETNTTTASATQPGIAERLGTPVGGNESAGDDGPVPELPARETLFVGLVAIVGAVAGVRRTNIPTQLR
ncbi:transglutaminase, partial [Enterococcus hirae]